MILVDTHVVLWLAFEPARLSNRARTAISEARRNADALAISDVTLLEITTLARRGRLALDISLELFLQEIENRFKVLPITGRACARSLSLPANFPKDPADRILAGTALVEGLTVLTADREIRRSKAVRTLW